MHDIKGSLKPLEENTSREVAETQMEF